MSGLLPPSLAGFTTSPSTCGVFGLLNSGGAFMTQIMGSVGFAQASLQGAAAMLMSLPGQVVGIVMADVQQMADKLISLAVGTMNDFVSHLTKQFDGFVNNLSLAVNQAAAQAGLVSSGCTLPSMGPIGTTGGLSACGNMANIFGSIMGSGQNLVNQVLGTVNNLTSKMTDVVQGVMGDISAAVGQMTAMVGQVTAQVAEVANMITSEVAALSGMLTDMITFGAANALESLFHNPCAKEVLNKVGSPALLQHLSA